MSAYRFFTPRTATTFRAIAGCIVPGDDASPGADGSVASTELRRDAALALADRAIADRPARDAKLLGLFLGVIEALPYLRYGRPFSALGQEQRCAVLSFLENNPVSKLRQGFFGVKTFVLLGHYGDEGRFAELRYPGPRRDAPYYQRPESTAAGKLPQLRTPQKSEPPR